MRKFKIILALAALVLAGCSSTTPVPEIAAAGRGTTATSLKAGDAKTESDQNDKHMNLGGSYLGDNKQSTAQIYGARKSSTPAWGGTLQAGVIQAGAATLKEMRESRTKAVKEDAVLIALTRRRDILLAQLEAMVAADPAADTSAVEARIDALTPHFETAMARIDESLAKASGGDFSALRAIVIGSLQNNGNRVGADALESSPEEFAAYGQGFAGLPEMVKAIMGSE